MDVPLSAFANDFSIFWHPHFHGSVHRDLAVTQRGVNFVRSGKDHALAKSTGPLH